ncbi:MULTISPECIES: stage II sporulation protein P [Paenibacillus]|uniref:stage II sporulation protein P n=1 Tax=Paenibacillus TaxID=44249 RepID=UPI00096D436E|nr:stage II sporulation protein P [Paenibacillus odorifer]MEC0133839.1 stage II sporulation protein P [Paenibacillus odorifer]MEC0221519.1 stage II sporulation protein P [Paenibacillus odorifer]OME37778.1 stage II sporulation protein P [Paenibacillus odorifer]OME51931.1 stage II sporulation protein P [Paenibacillus odorifer]
MNKKWFQLWNIGRLRGKMLDVLSLGRTMLLLAGGSLVFFLLLGAGGLAGQKLSSSPIPSMKGLAASLSSGFFMELLGMEVPHLPQGKETSAFSGEKVTSFVFQLLTSVNPGDPKSLVSREVPGMAADDPFLLRKGSGGSTGAPVDYHPGTDELAEGSRDAETSVPDEGDKQEDVTTQQPEATVAPSPDPSAAEEGTDKSNPQSGTDSTKDTSIKRILIYHSHPREAYNPLLGAANENPSSGVSTKNVMLVGSYITKRLEQLGIGTVHAKEDFPTKVTDYNWNFSYKYSRILVKSALSANEEMDSFIDIHRDSQRHSKTTAVIDGKSYAQVYFIIGHANKDWKKNEEFANKIHQQLEKNYPGISRGIWGKAAGKGNNGEYNQTLSPNSVLIEVGGIDNSAEELKRTADILADAIADVYWSSHDAQKVNAPEKVANPTTTPKKSNGAS